MYEFMRAGEHSYYVECPSIIGIVKTGDGEVCLIDSGSSKDAARKVRQILERENFKLKMILNTHSHADHIGGNQYLQSQTGCEIYASGLERAFTEFPILEPTVLYGGYAPKELHNKFLMAKESVVRPLTTDILPDGMELIPLPGHCYDMVGFRTADNVVYLADCLSSEDILEKYQIGFIYDVGAYLDTLEKVKNMQAELFIPSHVTPTDNIAPLAQINIDKTLEIAARILTICTEPNTFETILQKLFTYYDLQMDIQQYMLVGCTVRSYLSWLKDSGRLEIIFDDNQMMWLGK